MQKKKIIFRADGNEDIGLGHLYRLFALVDMFKDQFDFIFVTKENSPVSVIPKGYKVSLIPHDITMDKEIEWLVENFSSKRHIIIADGYQFNNVYQRKIKKAGYFLVYVDDLVSEHMYADIVVNHSLGVKKEDYQAEKYTQFALGTSFSILRSSFLKAASQSRLITKIDTCFVCFGGADMYNLTEKAVMALIEIEEIKEIYVVLGGAYKHKSIFDIKSNRININISKNVSEIQLFDIIKVCNFAIVPASTILYEVCAIKMPVLCGYYVHNQKNIYDSMLTNKVITGMGNLENYTADMFKQSIKTVLHDNVGAINIENQAKLFDGTIRERFINLLNAKSELCKT